MNSDYINLIPNIERKDYLELGVGRIQNSAVELWKQNNIGGNFNADKFISVVKEYV